MSSSPDNFESDSEEKDTRSSSLVFNFESDSEEKDTRSSSPVFNFESDSEEKDTRSSSPVFKKVTTPLLALIIYHYMGIELVSFDNC